MSDSLRDALEKLIRENVVVDRRPHDKHGPIGRLPEAKVPTSVLQDLLAAHPVEPASTGHRWSENSVHYPPTGGAHIVDRCGSNCPAEPDTTERVQPFGLGVSDEAVEAACRVSYARWDESNAEVAKVAGRKAMRAALEAAAPLMGATPQPTLDREAVRKVLDTHRVGWQLPGSPAYVDGYRDALTDDLAALVRPLPTSEQIDKLLRRHTVGAFQPEHSACACDRKWRTHAEHREHVRDELAALLDGTEGAK